MESSRQWRGQRGYMLFEVMIAVAIFAVVALSLAGSMQSAIESTNYLDRQLVVRYGLESILNEARQRPKRAQMTISYRDEVLGIDYRTELVETRFVNIEGEPVPNIYILRATAEYVENGTDRIEKAEVYVNRAS